jgi:N-acetylglucosamine malate deacetylase 1
MLQEHQITPYACTPLPCNTGPWLVVAPHADDESFGMGGTLAKAQQVGVTTHVVVLTDGALGGNADNLVAIRQQEARAAAQVLGVQSVHFFALLDRGLCVSDALVTRLIVLMQALQITAVFFPGAMELHPDHRSTALVVWRCLQQLGSAAPQGIAYEITGQSPVNVLVDITAEMPRKQQALAVYHSQLAENNYVDIVLALNKLRTLTLAPAVKWAEGYYCYSAAELRLELAEWLQHRVGNALLPTMA